jgi:C-terminal processing protease CtpA/Prc
VDEKTHFVLIKGVVPDSPAARAGLSPGLVVESINGVSTAKKSAAECVFLTRGQVDRTVWLVLVNWGLNQTNTMELERKFAVY